MENISIGDISILDIWKKFPEMDHMNDPVNIRSVIELWPTASALADDLALNVGRVYKWLQSGAIPAKYHFRMIAAAQARGFHCVSADLLVRLHAAPLDEDAA